MQFGEKIGDFKLFWSFETEADFCCFWDKNNKTQQKVDNIVPILLSLYNKLQNAKDKLERCSKAHLKA